MISTIKLKNFQCWKDLSLELGPITVLIGDNDSGKSTVLRALKWIALNQWDGEAASYIHWDADGQECSVEVVAGGRTIRRVRSSAMNGYYLTEKKGEEQKFPTLDRNQPPKAIAAILGMRRDHFQDQHDPAFWMSLSAPDAARALNDLFNISEIDEAMAEAGKIVRESRALVTATEQLLKSAEVQVEGLAWVEKAKKLLQQLNRIDEERRSLLQEAERIGTLLEEMNSAKKEISNIREQVQVTKQQLALAESYSLIKEEIDWIDEVQDLENELCRTKNSLLRKRKELKSVMKAGCPLCGK